MGRQKDKLDNLLREYYKAKYKPEGKRKTDISTERMHMMICENAVHYNEDSDFKSMSSKIQEKRTPCPKTDLLVEYLAGALNDNEKNKIDEHIKKCSGCKDKVMTGKDLIQRYKDGKLENVPEYISNEIAMSFNLRNKKKKGK